MPRYYFHINDGVYRPYENGTEFPSAADARNHAVVAAGEALKEMDGKFWNTRQWSMLVLDETEAAVCRLRVLAD